MAETASNASDAIIEGIDGLLHNLMVLENVLLNGNAEQKPVVQNTLEGVLQSMRSVDEAAAALRDVEVPAKLLQWLDEGKDPDAFFKALFDDTIWASQVGIHYCVTELLTLNLVI
jgi:hypothetical protein